MSSPSGLAVSNAIAEEESNRLRDEARTRVVQLTRDYLVLGKILYQIKEFQLFRAWGYTSFYEYTTSELAVQERRAQYIVGIWSKFIVEFGLTEESLESLPWTKARAMLSEVVTPDNVDSWMRKAGDVSVVELENEIRKMRGPILTAKSKRDMGDEFEYESDVKKSEQPKPSKSTSAGTSRPAAPDINDRNEFPCTFQSIRMTAEQAEIVKEAFSLTEKVTGSTKKNHHLEVICATYLAFAAGDVTVTSELRDSVLEKIELAFGLKIEAKDCVTGKTLYG